ncbi:S8 family serine peptidase [Raineya orbicola]|uniref:Subtilase family n=1 Tax=Raineya orbicola TaxID=2016530 RepID=A0A2N3IIA5_9BACT|nr:S8 family serine peptidase [Raineya orbicola]PKQ70011.1 Subtilase family [Raineya orbicola]
MKKHFTFLFVAFLLGFCVYAQVRYTPSQVVFKLKQNSYLDTDLLHSLSVRPAERVFPNHQAPKEGEVGRCGLPKVDLSRIYYLYLKDGVSVESALQVLRSHKSIEYAEPLRLADPLLVPNDPGANTPSSTPADYHQYYLNVIKAYDAWDVQTGNPSSIIGVIDWGFRTTHQDLIANLHPDYIDLGNNDYNLNLPHSFSYHGGAVAGIAAATPNNAMGIAGVGYNCRYLPVKAVNDALTVLRFAESVVYLADRNVKVINMSFGYVGEPDEFWEDVVNYAVINKDVAMVAAAGNNGDTGRFWPASYKNVVSVTGSTSNDLRWGGSNYNYEVDITAPSEFTHTTYYNCCAYSGIFNNDHSYIPAVSYNMSGTSFAAPQVAAAIALLRTQYPSLDAIQAMARVVATSDNIDALNPSFAGLIGKGRLNVHRAVSETNVKALRIENYNFVNNAFPFAGANAQLVVNFKNLLSPTSNLQVNVVSLSPLVSISSGSFSLGAMNTNEIKNNQTSPFILQISPSTPYNTEIVLRFDFQDGAFTSYEYLKIIINPDYLHLDINKLTLHVGSRGKIAEYKYPYRKSVGYTTSQYNTIATAGGLIIASHTDSIVNSVPQYISGDPLITEFDVNGSFTHNKTATYQEIIANFKDNVSYRPKLRITKKAYAYKDSPKDKFIIVEYDITNDSTRTIPNLYAGVFTDFDLLEYARNRADWDNARKMGYAYHYLNGMYAGIRLLTTETPNYYAFNNNGSSGSINLYNGFTKAEKFTAISNGLLRTQAGMSGLGTDVSMAVGATISNLAPNAMRKIAFAYVAGDNLAELQANADEALNTFVQLNTTPLPDIASNFVVCSGKNLILAPTNGSVFDFYDSFPLTTPIHTGSSLTLTNITTNRTIYIVGRDRYYPSPVKVVNITVAPIHQAVIIATLYGGTTWLFEDYSGNVSSSEWNFGDGNTATGNPVVHTFAQTGNYQVTLKSTSLQGCESITSKNIGVVLSLDSFSSQTLQIYPNPAYEEVFVKGAENFSWELMNVFGDILQRGTHQIRLRREIVNGLYYLKIALPSGNCQVFKLRVER